MLFGGWVPTLSAAAGTALTTRFLLEREGLTGSHVPTCEEQRAHVWDVLHGERIDAKPEVFCLRPTHSDEPKLLRITSEHRVDNSVAEADIIILDAADGYCVSALRHFDEGVVMLLSTQPDTPIAAMCWIKDSLTALDTAVETLMGIAPEAGFTGMVAAEQVGLLRMAKDRLASCGIPATAVGPLYPATEKKPSPTRDPAMFLDITLLRAA